jgi:hypothetical protein
MNSLKKQKSVATLAVTFVLSVAAAYAQDTEKKVKMSDLPEPVRKTVREQSKGATIRGLAKETENGITSYEVELKVNDTVEMCSSIQVVRSWQSRNRCR